MKRQITGLRAASDTARLPDGLFLVRVQNMKFQRHAPKPYYSIAVIVQEPQRFAGSVVRPLPAPRGKVREPAASSR